ncbi:MAG: Nif3-like dinuclear metal center hexameric protein [Bacteroidota bacterium]
MIVQEVIDYLEEFAPTNYAEDFDNVGLLVGNSQEKITGVLVTLDTLETVVDEAIEKDCNMIVSFHPIIFKGLKKITGKNYVERVVLKAIQNNIAIYAIHTALDNMHKGVNYEICNRLGLNKHQVLVPQQSTIKKLTAYVPKMNADKLRQALFNAGAGNIGDYSECSFNIEGLGSFKGNEDSNPQVGQKNTTEFTEEVQLNITYHRHLEQPILQTLFREHPYEEVAYEIETLENENQQIGIGMTGEFEEAKSTDEFLALLKRVFKTPTLRYSGKANKIKKVAVLGGSGAFAIPNAKAKKADAYITADLKYHDFYQAENQLILIDIGHYESEQYTKDLLHSYLSKKITNFAVVLSEINTNPIQYY